MYKCTQVCQAFLVDYFSLSVHFFNGILFLQSMFSLDSLTFNAIMSVDNSPDAPCTNHPKPRPSDTVLCTWQQCQLFGIERKIIDRK